MVKLVSGYWFVAGLVGWLFYAVSDKMDYSFYNINKGAVGYGEGLFAIVFSSFSFVFGAWLYQFYFLRGGGRKIDIINSLKSINSSGLVWLLFLLVSFSVIGYSDTYGLVGLFWRDFYIPDNPGWLATVAQVTSFLGIFSSVLLALVAGYRARIFSYVCLLILFLLVFSKGSRVAALAFAMFAMLPLFSSWRRRSLVFASLYIFIVVSFSLALMYSLLYFRAFNEYGVLPFFMRMPESFEEFYSNFDMAFSGVMANLSFILPVTTVTIGYEHSFSHILTAINPAPGFLTDWGEMGPTRRVSLEVPFNAIGEAYGFSVLFCFFYMASSGCFWRFAQEFYWVVVPRLQVAYLVTFFSFCSLFGLLVSQYNLRSATRIIFYQLAFVVIFYLLSDFLKRGRWSIKM